MRLSSSASAVVVSAAAALMTVPLVAGPARVGGTAAAPSGNQAQSVAVQPAITIENHPRPPVQYRAPAEQPRPAPPTSPLPAPVPHPPRSPEPPPSRGEHELRRMVIVYPTPVVAGPCVEAYSSSSSSSSVVTDISGSSTWTEDGGSGTGPAEGAGEAMAESQQQRQQAAVAAAVARAQVAAEETARGEVEEIRGRLELGFLASDAYRAAAAELSDARAAYDAAVVRARAGMKESAEYREAAGEARRAESEVRRQSAIVADGDAASASPPAAFSPQLVRAAQAKLDAVTVVSRIQAGYVANQPEVIAERASVTAAERRLNALRAQFEAMEANDPELRGAERRLEAVRQEVGGIQ